MVWRGENLKKEEKEESGKYDSEYNRYIVWKTGNSSGIPFKTYLQLQQQHITNIQSFFIFRCFLFFFLLPLLPSSFLPSPRFIKTLLRCKVLRKKFSKRKLYLSLRLTLKQLILCLKEKTTKKKKNFFSTKTCFICIFFFLIFSATLLIRTLL